MNSEYDRHGLVLGLLVTSFLWGCGDSKPDPFQERLKTVGTYLVTASDYDLKKAQDACESGVDHELELQEAACAQYAIDTKDLKLEAECKEERKRLNAAVTVYFEKSLRQFENEREVCVVSSISSLTEKYAYEFCEDAFQKKIEWLVEHECDYDYLNAISTVFAWRIQQPD